MDDLLLHTSWLGESAILCQTDAKVLETSIQHRIWALRDLLAACDFVTETVPGMNNILVLIDPEAVDGSGAVTQIQALWRRTSAADIPSRVVEIPVSYGGETGVDLPEVARACNLTPEAYIGLHSAGTYTVFALGSQPGFGYLAGLDPRLAVPRRAVPRPRLEAGAVVIGGAQAGVISRSSPSGWHVIGQTDISFFDPDRNPPALLSPGDTVRFVPKKAL
ncbi:5-oxoprolinase subunit PxpB [Haematobacter genomosp. 1]|uniref:Allophanate hydrolase n=1 Tax=Haematobacter genomosp. 1 TaxID=366618 RepID=A0A212AEF6_9RHOB|nr:5-oxoprolinase subunit PxpB [Haematobacter genomosp. 1]OWJ79696.1 allophanate hydrolase [Haematobacter genomosp. 1]